MLSSPVTFYLKIIIIIFLCHSFCVLDIEAIEAGDDPISSSKVALDKILHK